MDVRQILGRDERVFDDARSLDTLRGKTVLVTGAGGSIGSALCQRLARLPLAELILFEQSEGDLVDLERSLGGRTRVTSVLGDVTDELAVRSVIAAARPDVVYHAAALKHVVLLESNPIEAVRVNVFGTRIVVRASVDAGVQRFVFLSTDKAVRPTSLMGATKKLGERIVRTTGRQSSTGTVIARLVNVAGSRGSVVPRFMEQAKQGRPLTLSAAEASRLFISSGEAVSLLLAMSWLGDDGETVVPVLGLPRPMTDVASAVLRAAGRPGGDWTIVGLGPGEKLMEDPIDHDEVGDGSGPFHGVWTVPARTDDAPDLRALEKALVTRDVSGVVAALVDVLPGYHPSPVLSERVSAGGNPV